VRVDGRHRVVEHDHARIRDQRAGERDPLPLSAGEVHAALADQRVVTVGQLFDERGDPGDLARVEHLAPVGVGAPREQIVAEPDREEDGLLRDDRDRRPKLPERDVVRLYRTEFGALDRSSKPVVAALNGVAQSALARDLTGPLAALAAKPGAFTMVVHPRYNPEAVTQYNIVPGLMGVILTMTMVLMTGLAITREQERGTMENLLSTPATALEVMTGKIVPYVMIGLTQVTLVLILAKLIFNVPMHGNLGVLYLAVLLFIAANLTLGLTFSSIARNQLQAMQMTFFFFLPSILLSGFMFPFRGMPRWAQAIGEALPLTHFLRIVRGVLLKGNGVADVLSETWPLVTFMIVVLLIGLRTFKSTLD